MTTPRDLLLVLNDLAKRVAERQLAETDAIANLKHELRKYPKVRAQWTEERATAELDKRIKRHRAKGNAARDAEITRKLAELGLERPTLDGTVLPISEKDDNYSRTLGEYGDETDVLLANAWRMLKSFETREEHHALLVAAAGGNLAATREQALEALKLMPEAARKALQAEIKAKLAAERRAFTERRYGTYGQAAEG